MTAACIFFLLGMLPFQLQELNERLLKQCKSRSYNEKMNNVAGIWLKGRYIDKMPTYSRPGKIIYISKESSVQSMNMVPRGVIFIYLITAMNNINIPHKITGRIGDFHDPHLPLLKFAHWFIALTHY